MKDSDRELSALAFEQAAQSIAQLARSVADDMEHGPDVPGPAALRAFAQAILDANKQAWPPPEGKPS